MSTISAMDLGIQGIQKGMDGLRQNAQQIASNTTGDVTNSLIGMKLNELEVEMSAKVVKTASDMIGTLLDITA